MADKLEAYRAKGMVGKPLRVMVVGIPNTGKSSFINRLRQLIGNGFNILGIDPGEDLVRIGNERFKNESISFAKGRFEEYDFEQKKFDVIYAAQSFHWVPQPIGYKKCAEILKDNGYIALFWNMYVLYDNDLDKELLEISKRYGGIADFVTESECENRIAAIVSQIVDSDLFEKPTVIRKLWKQNYTADELYEDILVNNNDEKILVDIISRVDEYENYWNKFN